jgi:hypothetical protein
VTPDNIDKTICVPRYTNIVRPPASYTNRIKREQLDTYYKGRGDMSTEWRALTKEASTLYRQGQYRCIRQCAGIGAPGLPEHPDAKTVFIKLRELRHRW